MAYCFIAQNEAAIDWIAVNKAAANWRTLEFFPITFDKHTSLGISIPTKNLQQTEFSNDLSAALKSLTQDFGFTIHDLYQDRQVDATNIDQLAREILG